MSNTEPRTSSGQIAFQLLHCCGLGLLGGVIWKRPDALASRGIPVLLLGLATVLGLVLHYRGSLEIKGAHFVLLLGATLTSALRLVWSSGLLALVLGILGGIFAAAAVVCAATMEIKGMNKSAPYGVVAIPILGAFKIGLLGGWLLTRGRSQPRILAADQTGLSLVMLAMVLELLLFLRWRSDITRENGRLHLPPSLSRAGFVWLGNLKAWGDALLGSALLLMTLSREGVGYAVGAFVVCVLSQVFWHRLAIAAAQGPEVRYSRHSRQERSL